MSEKQRAAAHPAVAAPGGERPRLVNGKCDAGPWLHDDGSLCDVFLSDKRHPSECADGHTDVTPDLWWCTEHQSHLRPAAVHSAEAAQHANPGEHDPITDDVDNRSEDHPDLIDCHGAYWVWAIGNEYRARHVRGGWKCRDGEFIRRVFGPVTEVAAAPGQSRELELAALAEVLDTAENLAARVQRAVGEEGDVFDFASKDRMDQADELSRELLPLAESVLEADAITRLRALAGGDQEGQR